MDNLLVDLRDVQRHGSSYNVRRVCGQAADEIERLRRELAEARELLREAHDWPHKLDSEHSTLRARVYKFLTSSDQPDASRVLPLLRQRRPSDENNT